MLRILSQTFRDKGKSLIGRLVKHSDLYDFSLVVVSHVFVVVYFLCRLRVFVAHVCTMLFSFYGTSRDFVTHVQCLYFLVVQVEGLHSQQSSVRDFHSAVIGGL